MGAADEAAALELVEVAARGHRRDAEARLDLRNGHRAGTAHRLGDLLAAGLREHRARPPCLLLAYAPHPTKFDHSMCGEDLACTLRSARPLDTSYAFCFDSFRSDRRRRPWLSIKTPQGRGARERTRDAGPHRRAARRVQVLRGGARAARGQ